MSKVFESFFMTCPKLVQIGLTDEQGCYKNGGKLCLPRSCTFLAADATLLGEINVSERLQKLRIHLKSTADVDICYSFLREHASNLALDSVKLLIIQSKFDNSLKPKLRSLLDFMLDNLCSLCLIDVRSVSTRWPVHASMFWSLNLPNSQLEIETSNQWKRTLSLYCTSTQKMERLATKSECCSEGFQSNLQLFLDFFFIQTLSSMGSVTDKFLSFVRQQEFR